MIDQPTNTGDQGGEQLFQNMDQQERLYAPEQVPDADMPAEEVDTGGGAAATPPSDTFEPGMEREERDIRRGEEGYVGPDMRDEDVKPAGSVTQERDRRS